MEGGTHAEKGTPSLSNPQEMVPPSPGAQEAAMERRG